MTWLYIVLGALALAILYVLGGAIYAFHLTFYAPGKKSPVKRSVIKDPEQLVKSKEAIKVLIDDLERVEFEAVHIRSFDGTMLFARYYHVKDGAPVHIQFHGYRSYALRDFCGGAKLAMACGHNVLLVDQRAHTNSEGRVITFGIKERYDCLCVANYAYERFGDDVPIFLAGISMGAATVLMASELDLPHTVSGIIADCPFSSPCDIIKMTISRVNVPKFVMPYLMTNIGGMLFAGVKISSASCIKAVQNTNIPILMFHGTEDTIVPYEMGRKIFDSINSKDKFFYSFEGADHAMSYVSDPDKYEKAFCDFTSLCIKNFKNKISEIKE